MSNSNTHARAVNKRDYRLGKRAGKLEETRRRIVEAAVDLHIAIGPARTTITQIAERAKVQRHTFYAHFPDERSLFLACSGLAMERSPLPNFKQLQAISPGRARVAAGLDALYDWFERNSELASSVLRDAEHHALTREMVDLHMTPVFREAGELLGEGLAERARALLGVALDFNCWRSLGMHSPAEAAELMADAVASVAQP